MTTLVGNAKLEFIDSRDSILDGTVTLSESRKETVAGFEKKLGAGMNLECHKEITLL